MQHVVYNVMSGMCVVGSPVNRSYAQSPHGYGAMPAVVCHHFKCTFFCTVSLIIFYVQFHPWIILAHKVSL